MKKTVLLATAAVLALSVGGVASAAKPTLSVKSTGVHRISKNGVDRALTVLYDQTDNDSGIGIVSQNFESTFAQYDAQAADDFTVPSGKWTIKEVDTVGVYFNGSGPATSENVFFYKNKNGHPGKVLAEYDGLVGSDSFGSFAIKLPTAKKLKAGTYWVSVVANLAFLVGGEWGWENQTTSEGNPAQWQNPAGAFGVGCTTWGQENVCIPDGQGDHMFALRGKAKG